MTETLQEETRRGPRDAAAHAARGLRSRAARWRRCATTRASAQVETAFGMPAFLVARHADVKAVLADSARFSNDSRRAFDAPGAPTLSDEERDADAGGQPARRRPAGAHPPAPDAHPGVHGPPDAPAGAADRRDRRRPPRRDGEGRAARGPRRRLRAADPVAGDLRAARGARTPTARTFQERTSRLLDISLPMDERLELGRESREYMADLVAAGAGGSRATTCSACSCASTGTT